MGNKMKTKKEKAEFYVRISIIAVLSIYLIAFYPGYYPLPQLTAKVVSFILGTLNISSAVDGTFIVVAFPELAQALELSAECSGIILFAMFIFVVFIVPDIPLSHRLVAILFIPLLFLANLFRIIAGIIVGYHTKIGAVDFFHNTIGQVLMFFIAISVYMTWLHFFGHFPHERANYKKDLDF